MNDIEDFRRTLTAAAPPPDLDLALRAIWWAGKGDWAQAHGCAQQDEGNPDCDLVHAHLHRQEGDLGNARYWYRRSGHPAATGPLEDEWVAIAQHLLQRR